MTRPPSMIMPPITIDVIADPVCPWCFVGLHSFLKAKDGLSADWDVTVRYRPYQLNPDTPADGADRKAYYAKKFPDQAMLDQMRATIRQSAEAIGAPFDPSSPPRLPNTLKAHQLLQLAQFHGAGEAVVKALYDAYWVKLEDIGDTEVLTGLATACGIDAAATRDALAETRDAVSAEANAFRQAGVSGVPTFIVNERQGFSGAHPPETLEKALRHAANAASTMPTE